MQDIHCKPSHCLAQSQAHNHQEIFVEWMNVGGEKTIAQFRKLSVLDEKKVYDYIKGLPLYKEISVDNKNYVLVHGGLKNFTKEKALSDYKASELLFEKPEYYLEYYNDKILL